MTNVFVVIKKDWDDFEVMGTFTSMEKANEFIGSLETMEERVNCTIFVLEKLVNRTIFVQEVR